MNHSTYDCLIIGAGICGLLAGKMLQDDGLQVKLIDKGRGVGGRMGTRRFAGGRADHGAQLLWGENGRFQTLLAHWNQNSLLRQVPSAWFPNGGVPLLAEQPMLIGVEGMNSVPRWLASGLAVQTGTRITAVSQLQTGWKITSETGEAFTGRRLLLTLPVPQALTLLRESGIILSEPILTSLEAIQYAMCLTGIFHVVGETTLQPSGILARPGLPFHWLADNRQKGISPQVRLMTIQANGAFSAAHWEQAREQTLAEMRVEVEEHLGEDGRVLGAQLMKWRYAYVVVGEKRPFLQSEKHPSLFFAGDGFGIGNVEGAALSGLAVGEAMGRDNVK